MLFEKSFQVRDPNDYWNMMVLWFLDKESFAYAEITHFFIRKSK